MNNLILKSFLLSLLTFFAPVGWIILVVSLSTIIDTFFGIWRSLKSGGKFKSKILRFGFVPKVLSYCGSIMFVYCCDYFIINDLINLGIQIDYLTTKLLALGLIGIEIKSMICLKLLEIIFCKLIVLFTIVAFSSNKSLPVILPKK